MRKIPPRTLTVAAILALILLAIVLLLPITPAGGEEKPPAPSVHPRLYFSVEEMPALARKMQQPVTGEIWDGIRQAALGIQTIPSGITDGDPDRVAYDTWSGLTYPSFYYALTGDTTVGNRAKTWLLQVCSWSSWTYPERKAEGYRVGYHTGKIAIAVGQAYDWLYPLLTETERQAVRTAIMDKGVTQAYVDYQSGRYRGDAQGNRIAHSFGGIGVAAYAILGEDPSNPGLEPYLPVIEKVMEEYVDSFDRQGGWSEGVGYQGYGLCDASGGLYYMEAAQRVRGIDLYDRPGIRNAIYFPLYLLPPDRKGSTDSFSDISLETWYSAAAVARLASAYRNGHAQWYYHHVPVYHHDLVPEFLWYDGTVEEVPPDTLPRSRLFPDIGWAALRTGWGVNDTLLVFRSGPKFTDHNRPEQNSFMLDARGERLIIAPALSSLGYSDPAYYPYYAATVSQNTVLVNHNPLSQNRYVNSYGEPAGRITEFISTDFYDAVTGSAAAAYGGSLSRYIRHIVFIRKDYVVLFDELESAGEPVEFDSLFHTFGTGSIRVSGSLATYTRGDVTLFHHILKPDRFRESIQQGLPAAFMEIDQPTSYLRISPPEKTTAAQFLHVLTPLRSTGSTPPVTLIDEGGIVGTRVTRDGDTEEVLFNPGKTRSTAAGILSDGEQFVVIHTASAVEEIALHNGRELSREGQQLYASGNPTSMAFRFTPGSIEGKIQASSSTEISLWSADPEGVALNGELLPAGSYAHQAPEGMITFTVPAGETSVSIRVSTQNSG